MWKWTAAAVLLVQRAAEALCLLVPWRRSPGPAPPGRLDREEYDSLLSMVGLFLSVRRQRARLAGGELEVEAEDGVLRFELAPLVEACGCAPRNAWPYAVAAFLGARLGWPAPEPEPAPAPLASQAPVALAAREPAVARLGTASAGLKVHLGRAALLSWAALRRLAARWRLLLRRAAARSWRLLCRPGARSPVLLRRGAAFSHMVLRPLAAHLWVVLRGLLAVSRAGLGRAAGRLREAVRRPGVTPAPAAAVALLPPPALAAAAALERPPASPGRWRDGVAGLLKPRRGGAGPEAEADEWSAFCALLVECCRRHGLAEATVGRNVVLARDAAGRRLRLQVPGLERAPCELRRERWEAWVDEVLGERLRALRGREALAKCSFGDVRELLALQLYDDEWLGDDVFAEAILSRDLPGLMSALVCRLPEGAFRLSGQTVTAWKVDVQEVAAAALANLRRLRPLRQRVCIAPGAQGMRFEEDGDFAAAQAVLLGENTRCAQAYGALVAVPRRSLLLVCPLRPMAGAAAVYAAAAAGLIRRVLASEAEGHAPLSRRLYWYRKWAFVDLPYEVPAAEGKPAIEFTPAGAFAAALAEMEAGA